jgi:hypothetical protein
MEIPASTQADVAVRLEKKTTEPGLFLLETLRAKPYFIFPRRL